ncbi:hypothetical protein [Azotobacter beijerinckii]|uniref:Uncharacterized protein n=1 Tax=Azotobacter beijerinckii TaxID=170623 RepID=A0A1I4B7B1_9GAMM|nr:hypothetical protein [Azotobacter beijerinckii]SFB05560.1 hypothetical protein SAMN04244571_01278 [Azotobacter beijerinckii]SFK64758.1 hypothetical protein SAMN04244574_01357 [Azotobacter beijerinckii]
MKADRDDAPDYLRDRKNNRWRFLAILASGSAIAWAAITLFAKPITIDLTTLKNAIHIGDQDADKQQRIEDAKARALAEVLASHKENPPRQTSPEIHAYRPTPPPAEPQPRQTVFNDQNYKPRTDINTITAVSSPTEYNPPPQRREKPQAIRRGPEPWQWENYNGSQREYVYGWFQWLEINGKIDWSSVCMNEQAGSLRHRDCRQGAKVAFAEMCSRYEPACQAENNYNPAM